MVLSEAFVRSVHDQVSRNGWGPVKPSGQLAEWLKGRLRQTSPRGVQTIWLGRMVINDLASFRQTSPNFAELALKIVRSRLLPFGLAEG